MKLNLLEKRKVIGTGLISIPSFWRHLKQITKGETLSIIATDNALIILKQDGTENEVLKTLGIEPTNIQTLKGE